MHKHTFIVNAVVLGIAFVLSGCSKSDTSATTEVEQSTITPVTLANAVCPLMGGKVKESVTTEWNGKTIGFCCPDCIPAWEKLSDEEKTAKLAEAAAAGEADEHDEHEHEESDHEHSS